MRPLSYRTIFSADVSTQQSQLFNRQFEDIYHHQKAMAESQEVFLEANRLSERWRDKADQSDFVIAETGFGSGLNFLTTRRLWHASDHKPGHLHFISCEQWLLSPEQFEMALGSLPDLQADAATIRHIFSHRRAGFHRYRIDKDITLHLLLGDACACFQQLNAAVDAWFLDGFSPAKNPAMWSQELFTELARLSAPGATFATFTAASKVRKNLQSVGFEVSKKSGFEGKRERLIGHLKTAVDSSHNRMLWAPTPQANPPAQSLTIIGAGIAGLCLAHVAKANGLEVTLIDQHPQALAAASGNAYAMMMPYLTAQSSPEALFYWRAFEAALDFYPRNVFNPVGVQSSEQPRKYDARFDLPDDLIQTAEQGLYYPGAGFVDTNALGQHLSQAVDNRLTAEVADIEQTPEQQWLIKGSHQQEINRCDVLVVAAGIQSIQLLPALRPFVTARAGQTEVYQLTHWPSSLNQVQHNQRYLIPIERHSQVLIGGDYRHLDPEEWFQTPAQLPKGPQLNLTAWQNQSNSTLLNKAQWQHTHVGIRANTLDHLPLCGPLVMSEQFKKDYADLHHGRHWQSYPPAKTSKNLYILSGLGSRGYTSAPLLAQYLMAMILNQPLPIEQDLVKILHPNRFDYRQLKKPPQKTTGDKL